MASPNRITRIDEQLSNDVHHQATTGDLQQKISAKTKVVEEVDQYPGFLQQRIDMLNERITSISEVRLLSMLVIGVVTAYVSLIAAMAFPAALGVGLATIATSAAAIYAGTYPNVKRLRKEEAKTAAELGSYLRARSLVMASHANEIGALPAVTPASPVAEFASVANNNQPAAQPQPQKGSTSQRGPIQRDGLN